MKNFLKTMFIIVLIVSCLVILTGCDGSTEDESSKHDIKVEEKNDSDNNKGKQDEAEEKVQANSNNVKENKTSAEGKNEKVSNTPKTGLASKVKVGDYVDYKVEKGNSYTSSKDKTGYDKDQVFETTGEEKWRVMSLNDDGSVNLALEGYAKTVEDSSYYLKGKAGIDNYNSELDNIANIYLNSNYATSSRMISRSDIEEMLDLDATVNCMLKIYDSDSSLYTRDTNIDKSGTRKEVFESISKTYYSYNKFSYGDIFKVDNEQITFNKKFMIQSGLESCIIDDYKDVLDDSWEVWLAGDVENFFGNNWNWNSDYIDYDLPKFTYNNKSSTYKLKSENMYKLYLDGSDGEYTKSSEYEYSASGGVKPVVTLKSSANLNGGTGTSDDPYILK